MSSSTSHKESTDEAFQWLPEYDTVLATIASTDSVGVEWGRLRDMIKYKISENISLFQESRDPPPPPPAFVPTSLQSGGLKLPPFPPRRQSPLTSFEIPVNYMNDEQADQMKQYIFDQLDQFEANPPFTIQRVCELCMEPKRHYKAIGKYLRAVEKSLLVTSTWDSFPLLQESDLSNPTRSLTVSASTTQSTPSTPLFSPIPFLHADARRSKSRSPPPSPLNLAVSGGPEPLETKPLGLGLVDELDAPGPGHMSEHPTALSAVTSVEDKKGVPIVESLESRFVKAEASIDSEDSMVVDDNKENTRS